MAVTKAVFGIIQFLLQTQIILHKYCYCLSLGFKYQNQCYSQTGKDLNFLWYRYFQVNYGGQYEQQCNQLLQKNNVVINSSLVQKLQTIVRTQLFTELPYSFFLMYHVGPTLSGQLCRLPISLTS